MKLKQSKKGLRVGHKSKAIANSNYPLLAFWLVSFLTYLISSVGLFKNGINAVNDRTLIVPAGCL